MRGTSDAGRSRLAAALGVVALFVVAGAALALIAPEKPVEKAAEPSPWKAVEAIEVPPPPTPFFASLRDVRLRLPVPAEAVTVLVFHQSSYRDTVALSSLVASASPARARAAVKAARAALKSGGEATVAATPADGTEDGDGVWTGSALQLWRTNSGGKQDTAIDCGAAAGTAVFSPVDGTVMQIRPYRLYKKYDDFEIHIKPDAWDDLDVIVLHVTDPAVEEGTHVIGGMTRIASVRDLAKVVSGLQLRNYTLDGGNHTHVQVNKIPKPGEPWILGQDPPGFVRHD
jgi:murein DD-endopeptidase MepM/ murein hydrolase activator NlpD